MLRQLEKNQEILPLTRDEALFCCGVSSEIPPSILSLGRLLDTLGATLEFPECTSLHSRGTPMVPQQLNKSPGFPNSSREEGPFPCIFEKGIAGFPSDVKRGKSQLDTQEELQGSCHHFKRPRCPNALQIHLTPLQLTRWSPRGRTQNTMAGVTARWHLERKPPIPMSTRQEA